MWTLTTTLKIFLQNPSWCIIVKVRYLCIWNLKLKLIGPGNFSWLDYKTCIVHQYPCQESHVFFWLFCPCYTTSLWHPMGELLNLMSFCFDPSIPRGTRILFLPYRQSSPFILIIIMICLYLHKSPTERLNKLFNFTLVWRCSEWLIMFTTNNRTESSKYEESCDSFSINQ